MGLLVILPFFCYLVELLNLVGDLLQLCFLFLCQKPGTKEIYDVVRLHKLLLFFG